MSEAKKETVKKETVKKDAELSVAEKKVKALAEYLESEKVTGFGLQKFNSEENVVAFRSNLPVQGQNLPFMVVLDDSVYTMLQFQIAEGIVTADKKEKVAVYLNDLNDQFRMLKYHVDQAGNILLTCSMPSGADHFEPALVIAVLNQIQGHLTAVYPEIMKKTWEK